MLANRRNFISFFATLGLSSTLFPGVLWAQVQEKKADAITKEMLAAAEQISGVHFTDAQREMMLEWVNDNHSLYTELSQVHLDVNVAPALHFNPILPGMKFNREQLPVQYSDAANLKRPKKLEEVAYWNIVQLAHLIKQNRFSRLN
jgi:hypothetical protein